MTEVGAILLTGLVASAVGFWGIFSQRAIARRRFTIELLARTEADKDMIEARKQFISLANEEGGLAKYAEASKESCPQTHVIRQILNEHELIAIGIQRGVIDLVSYRRWNRSAVIKFWSISSAFVKRLRERTHNDALYHEFEQMYHWMNKTGKPPKRIWWLGKVV